MEEIENYPKVDVARLTRVINHYDRKLTDSTAKIRYYVSDSLDGHD